MFTRITRNTKQINKKFAEQTKSIDKVYLMEYTVYTVNKRQVIRMIVAEKERKEYTEEDFTEFSRLMYRTAALPPQAREKVAAYTQGILAMSDYGQREHRTS